MGSCMSAPPFHPNEGIQGQDQLALNVMKEKLLLSDENISVLHKAFSEIDTRQAHYIKIRDLHVYFHLEDTFINRKVFQKFEVDELHFLHFVCSVWHFLSMRTSDLSRYLFYLFCDDRSEEMNPTSLKEMMESLHGKGYNAHKDLKKLTMKFEQTIPHADVDEFVQFTAKYASLTDPLKRLQLVMRQTLIGDKFWRELSQKRSEIEEMENREYVLDVSMDACLSADALDKKLGGRRRIGSNSTQRKPKSNKFAVVRTHLNKVLPLAGDDEGIKKIPSKSPHNKNKPNDVVISVEDAASNDPKIISKFHTHASQDETSPHRRGSRSPATGSPRSPKSGSPRRKSSVTGAEGSPRLRVVGDNVNELLLR